MIDQEKWQWWSGRDDEVYTQGPFDRREDAIDEAFAQDDYQEEQGDNGELIGRVYVVEARGSTYDCDECGVVERACKACDENLMLDEPRWLFRDTRNAESVTRELESN